MAAGDFSSQINEARQNGYSDDEILGHLSSRPELSPKIQEAKTNGYASSDILNHLSTPVPNKNQVIPTGAQTGPVGVQPQKPGFWGTIGGDIAGIPHTVANVARLTGVGQTPESFNQAFQELAGPNINLVKQGAGETANGQWLGGPVHMLEGLTPGVGPMAHQAATDISTGNYSAGAARLAELGAPALSDIPIPASISRLGAVASGAMKGGARSAIAPIEYGFHKLPIPSSLAGGAAGRFAGEQFGPHGGTIGAVVGAATPFVRGAIKGGKEAATDFDRQALIRQSRAYSPDLTPVQPQPSPAPIEPIPATVLPSGRVPGGPAHGAELSTQDALKNIADFTKLKRGATNTESAQPPKGVVVQSPLKPVVAPSLQAQILPTPLTPPAEQPAGLTMPLLGGGGGGATDIPGYQSRPEIGDLHNEAYAARHAETARDQTWAKDTNIVNHIVKQNPTLNPDQIRDHIMTVPEDQMNTYIKNAGKENNASYKPLGKSGARGRSPEETRRGLLQRYDILTGRINPITPIQ